LPIKRLQEGNMLRVVSPDGQRAVTGYETIRAGTISGHTISLLHLHLETGRTHQIRVHCHSSGCPILGDILYYDDASSAISKALNISSQALHADTLLWRHPVTNAEIELCAPIKRDDMNDIIERLCIC